MDNNQQLLILYLTLLNTILCMNNAFTTLLQCWKRLEYQKSILISEILSAKSQSAKKVKRLQKARKYWIRPGRTSQWFQNFLDDKVAEEEWGENFRMSKQSFIKLCDLLRGYLEKQTTTFRLPISVEKQVGMFLYYIADEGRLRKTGNAFGVAKSTTSKVIRQVGNVISMHLAKDYIALPKTDQETKLFVSRFHDAHGFPQCMGAIDGTHVGIAKPKDSASVYINKSSTYSLNIQAICDYRYCFLDVVIRWPGCVHDARMFANSRLNQKLKDGLIPRCPATIVKDEPAVPVCILGDPAYPLMPYLMKEFVGGGQTTDEQFYGYRLSSARMAIECAFGRLKGRFGCLRRNMDINLKDLPAIIHSCFILHNFCEFNNNPVPPHLIDEAENYDRRFQPRQVLTNASHSNNNEGKRIRNIFVKYFE